MEEFLVFELNDSGERKRVEVREENLQSVLHPEQVLVIVKEDLRRIFIWKGAKSPVRKRFISSRVAQDLQTELQAESKYHRCKIISVDQGEEIDEFLSAFRLESMQVTEKLKDMYYVRNIERNKMQESGLIDKPKQTVKKEEEKPYYSPALQDTSNKPIISSITIPAKSKEKLITKPLHVKETVVISEEQNKIIKEKILKTEPPENYERENLIIGHSLYGAVSKKVKVFGKDVEEIIWEPVKKFPSQMVELEDHRVRIYFDKEKEIVEAMEILKLKNTTQKAKEKESITESESGKGEVKAQGELNLESWTIKDLRKFCSENSIDVPPSARKAEVLKAIKAAQNKNENKKIPSSIKRELPNIPSDKDQNFG